jgi:hypothetical protein
VGVANSKIGIEFILSIRIEKSKKNKVRNKKEKIKV